MQHLEAMRHERGFRKRNTDVFGGTGTAGIDRVQVHLEVIGNIAAHHGALNKVQIVELVADPRGVMKILHPAFPIGSSVHINQMHSCTGGTVMNLGAAKVQVMSGVTCMQGDRPVGLGNGVFDQRPGESHPAVITKDGTCARHMGDAGWRCVGKPDLLQRIERGLMDPVHAGLGQRSVSAARLSRAHRAQVIG